jgi:hypothetical protein
MLRLITIGLSGAATLTHAPVAKPSPIVAILRIIGEVVRPCCFVNVSLMA